MATFAVMENLFTFLGITPLDVVVMMLAMLVIELMRVLGRAHERTKQRLPFTMAFYFSDWVNWLSLVVSVFTGLLLLIIRDGAVDAMGLAVRNAETFGLFWAAAVGSCGQSIWKMCLRIVAAWVNGPNAQPPVP